MEMIPADGVPQLPKTDAKFNEFVESGLGPAYQLESDGITILASKKSLTALLNSENDPHGLIAHQLAHQLVERVWDDAVLQEIPSHLEFATTAKYATIARADAWIWVTIEDFQDQRFKKAIKIHSKSFRHFVRKNEHTLLCYRFRYTDPVEVKTSFRMTQSLQVKQAIENKLKYKVSHEGVEIVI